MNNFRLHLSLIAITILLPVFSYAQQSVGIGTNSPNPRAVLQLVSPGQNQGFLLPKLTTTEINTMPVIASDRGLMVYDSLTNEIKYWSGTLWISIGSGGATNLNSLSDVTLTAPAIGNYLRYNGVDWVNSSTIFPINETVAAAGTQFQLNQTGPGTTFRLTNSSPLSTDFVMSVEAFGDAIAGYFVKNNPASTNQAFYSHTLGTGPALVSFGLGNNSSAARFANTSISSTQPSVIIENAGTGLGLNVASGGVRVNRFGGGGNKMIVTNNTGVLDTAALPTSQWITNGSNIYYNSGNVGIGTIAPTERLHVVGNSRVTGISYSRSLEVIDTLNQASFFRINSTVQAQNYIEFSTGRYNGNNNRTDSRWQLGLNQLATPSDNDFFGIGRNNIGYDFVVNRAGSVGIGTESPLATFHVQSPNSRLAYFQTNNLSDRTTALELRSQGSSAGWLIGVGGPGNALGLSSNQLYFQSEVGNTDFIILNGSGNVGIGTTSPTQKLDVTGNIRFSGALMPNNTAGTAGQVLTSAGAGLPPTWAPAGGSGWDLTGNAGTNPSTNFIGTTDNNPIRFRVNNIPSGYLGASDYTFYGYQAGINNTGGGNTGFGHRTLATVVTAFENTAVGNNAQENLTTGIWNVAVGSGALRQLNTANYNTAVGTLALASVLGNWSNTAVGSEALQFTKGSGNIGIGRAAGQYDSLGDFNTYLGFGTGPDTTLSLTNATAVGASTRLKQSNTVILGNNSNVGIGTSLPSQRLDVVGNIKFSGALMPNNQTGVAGQVLTSSGPGLPPTWNNAAGTGWLLSGNSGINPALNYLGTSDAQPLNLRTNNQNRISISETGRVNILESGVFEDYSLRIQANQTAGLDNGILINRNSFNNFSNASIAFKTFTLSGDSSSGIISLKNDQLLDRGLQFITTTGGLPANAIMFSFLDPTTARVMSILRNGNTAIGNVTPTERLHVAGNIRFSGALMPNNTAGTAGQVLTSAGPGLPPTWTAVGGSGTVTSIGTGTGLTGGPITTTGTISLANSGVTAGTYGGAAAVGTFTVDATGRLTSASNQAIAINTSQVTTGTFTIAQGGTNGTAVPAAGAVAYGTGSAYAFTAAGSAGQLLQSNGSGAPTWVNAPAAITASNGLTRTVNDIALGGPLTANTSIASSGFNLSLTGTGRFGVGTATPNATFNIDHQSNTSRDAFNIVNARDNVGSAMPFYIGGVTAGQTYNVNTLGRLMRLENTTQVVFTDIGIDGSGRFFITRSGAFDPNADFAISATGLVGIGKNAATERLDVAGNVRFSGALMPNNIAGTAGQVLSSNGAGVAPTWASPNSFGWGLTGNAGINPAINYLGTSDGQPLVMRTSGTERVRILSGGNVGIGTATPASTLSVVGKGQFGDNTLTISDANDDIYIEKNGNFTQIHMVNTDLANPNIDGFISQNRTGIGNGIGNTTPGFNVWTASNHPIQFGTNGANRMTISSAGNIGIGNVAPTERLDVTGNVRFSGALMPNNTAGTAGQVLTSAGAGLPPTWSSGSDWGLLGNAGTVPGTNFIGTTDNVALRFRTNNADRLTISNTGSVGIGTTAPAATAQLHVVAPAGNLRARFETGGGTLGPYLALAHAGGREFIIGSTGTGNAAGANKLDILDATASVSRLVIDATGNVGVGNVAPSERLDVTGNVRFSGALMPNNIAGTAGQVLSSNGAGLSPSWTNPSSFGWSLLGNAGTVDGTNFIGTSDNVPFTIRTNNIRSARIEPAVNGNALFGFEAGLNVPNVSASTAMGYQALRAAAVGSQNTAIGYMAMNVTNNAIQNVAVGMNAMVANTTGSQNTGVGYGVMSANLDGLRNVAVGMNALNANTTGDDNVSIGYQSLLSNVGGNFNVGVGSQALQNTTASNNVAIGVGAGAFNTSGTNNTFLGSGANASVNNLTNATAIGTNAIVSQSNTVILGSGANIGLGTSTPARRLHVQQTGGSGGMVLEGPSNSGTILDLLTLGTGAATVNNAATRGWQWIAYGNAFGSLALQNDMALFSYNGTGGTNVMHFDAAGNVGLGTTAPLERLHVGANIFLQNDLNLAEDVDHTIRVSNRTTPSANGSNLVLNASNAGSGGLGVSGGSITLRAGDAWNNGGAGTGGAINIISGGNFLSGDNPGFITMSTRTGTVTTERIRILASGNVGIGTTAPTAQLHTTGGVRFAAFTGPGLLTVDASGNVGSVSGSAVVGSGLINRLTYWNTGSTIAAGSNLGWDNANENLGVGWPAPERNLHLHRASGADVFSKYTNTNTFVGAGNGFEVGILAAGDAIFRNMEPTSMQFHTSNTERMRISAAGNVGIGTTTPNAPLQFSNALVNRKVVLWDGANNDHQYYGFGVNASTFRYQVDATIANHVFFAATSATTSNELMRITGTGNVGIGTNAPQAALDLRGPSSGPSLVSNNEVLRIQGTGGGAVLAMGSHSSVPFGSYIQSKRNNNDGTTWPLALNPLGGPVGIGTLSPSRALSVVGDIDATGGVYFGSVEFFADGGGFEILTNSAIRPETNNTRSLGNSSFRWTTVFATNGSINTSDARLKENITNLDHGLQSILELRPVSYNWIDDTLKRTKLGLIAQEAEKVIPEVVHKPQTTDDYYGLNYADLVPVLIKTAQELHAKIEVLEKENTQLRSQLSTEVSAIKLKHENDLVALKKQLDHIIKIVGEEARNTDK